MNHIVMLLSNPFRPDPRVLKEASSLAEIGYDVTILCWDRTALLPEKEILSSGVKIQRIHNVRSSYGIGARQITHLIAFWRQILTLLDDLQPDIVHCHDFDSLPAGLWWRRRNNAPIMYDAHEHYAELIKPRLQGSIGKLFYRVIRWAEYRSAQKGLGIQKLETGSSQLCAEEQGIRTRRYEEDQRCDPVLHTDHLVVV